MGFFRSLSEWANRVGRAKVIVGVAFLLIVLLLLYHFLNRPAPVPVAAPAITHVHVVSVASLSTGTGPLPVTGKVTSLNSATILTQSAGEIVSLSHKLGDHVTTGSIIAQLENSSQAAAVQQAQGAYNAAQAALDKVQKGTRTEQLDILQSALDGARSGAVNTILSSYSSVDGAVRGTADTFFSNPTSASPHFNVSTANSNLKTGAENERVSLTAILDREKTRATTLTASDDLATELAQTTTEVRTVRDYLDAIIAALNSGIATTDYPAATIATYITSASTARITINTALSSLASTKQALETAQSNLDQGVTGAQPEDVASAQANVQSALGTLNAAKANLEKTIIRSPISGTIVNLSITKGDFVSSFSQVAAVSNPNALEIIAYVTPADAKTLAVGGAAAIDGNGTHGVIVSIAPALDPTNGKIEVKIGITGDQSALTDGDTLAVSLDRTTPKTSATSAPIMLPIAAAKITPEGPLVFTVADGKLVANPVVFGKILGDQVTIMSGITADTQIVTDARGLSDGESVIVDPSQ